jgi:D-alanyl-D-alanine carboxypeptidase/D-alanyl-D-alanine-endopeptidase (penicillin-binding protein 4)
LTGWIAAAVALTACAARPVHPAQPAAAAAPAVRTLVSDIDAILADPVLAHGYWGIVVKSLKSGEPLYERDPGKLLMPASNMKIVTLAAAAEKLGWDYTYETTLRAAGRIDGGRLDGDLIVVGSGDPSVTDGEAAARLFDSWADRLKALGVHSINGRVIGDDNVFDDDELGFGWSWDDVPDDYAAGVSALQFNENSAGIVVGPGPGAGDSASVSVSPVGSGLVVDSLVTTSAADRPSRIEARRLPGSARLTLRGSVPVGSAPGTRAVSVDNPTLFFVTALRSALIARGIDVRGAAVDIDDVRGPPSADTAAVAIYRSPPLSTLAIRLMKVSQNLYAETLLKTIGRSAGTPTFAAGRSGVQAALLPWGVGASDLIVRDGSGLSRYDFVTADALVTILTHIARDDRLRGPFEATLPIAGRDGSLSNRMKGTAAEGNARAKTGSMTNVRALSGYVTSADGEPLVWSIIANNFETPPDTITKTTDAIVVRLATFRR